MSHTDPNRLAADARRVADAAEATAQRLAAEDAADAAQTARDAADPRIGTTVTLGDGQSVTIQQRVKMSYQCRKADGSLCWVLVSGLDRVEQRAAAASEDYLGDVIRSYQRTAAAANAGDLRARAAQALVDLEAIRAGGEPAALTDTDRAKILARLRSGPREPTDPETAAAILRRLDPAAAQQQAAGAYEAGVKDNVHRLITKRVRATRD